jgi:GrpB protein
MGHGDDPILIREYDPTWPDQFDEIAARTRTALGDLVLRIEHIGSTAVPGLAAKPARSTELRCTRVSSSSLRCRKVRQRASCITITH